MRLSHRVGSAAALIILALFLLIRRLSAQESPKSFWRFDTTSFRVALRPQPAQEASHRKWGAGTGRSNVLTYQQTPIVIPDEGIIVMGKLREEDTAWVSAELAE
jgi:hypothetical protein